MSTPSPVPLDNFDPVSPYAPKWARDDTAAVPDILESQLPDGIETDHDARILDEIEASLRTMIAESRCGEELNRLSDVSRAAAEQLLEQQDHALDTDVEKALPVPEAPHQNFDAEQLAADIATVRAALRDPRTPPWLLARSLEPEPVPEPWPQKRKRRSNTLFLRFGLAVTGAAVVAAIAVKDVPTLVMDTIRGPLNELSTGAAAVFNEGKASSLQLRMESARKEQDRATAPSIRNTVAAADADAQAVLVRTETISQPAEPRAESVMTRWPSPEAATRSERVASTKAAPHPPAPATTIAAATESAAAEPERQLNAEEIAMLRKMGDDYIAAGDFVGARAVLERAADAGDASAAFAVASTYDPVVLARFKVRGLKADIVKASFWYERARELGSQEAPHRLQAMMAARDG
ncbi:MAG: hypothetical protein AB7V13_10485 [Pseudorhodoplanes sp.]|uniref:hypothetical protein n=1 Tax=Pseudorhodoplanes sp. TaxID=1934341 RepID=UPI003D0F2978